MHKVSKLFWPVLVTPKGAVVKPVEAISRSQKLMTELGLIKTASNGTYHIMPIGQRALNKCIDLVHRQMRAVGGQQISMPVLTSTSLWEKTGRLKGDITEFFTLRDRHEKEFLLSPTHEEAVTAMMATASAPISYRQLPLRLYQVGPKFRDELKTRFGLMRAKEFLMKDMYTFDRTIPEANETYNEMQTAYEALFQQLEVPFIKVKADAGMMGGHLSHEFHYITATGEDRILQCKSCGHASNIELTETPTACPQCKSATVEEVRGIEIAHAFLLGGKYSKPLKATFLQPSGKPAPFVMGCYGVGISRLVAATLEVLSTDNELRWPTLLAPYDICIIGPKSGSNEQVLGDAIEAELCQSLADILDVDDVLHDDRKHLTIGKRLLEAKRMGYPLVMVVGSKATDTTPKIELHLASGEKVELELTAVLKEVKKYKKRKTRLLNGFNVSNVSEASTESDKISLKV